MTESARVSEAPAVKGTGSRLLAYQPALDGIRALAVLAVLAYHAGMISGGYLGVDVFFLLSGNLITSLLLAEHHRTGRLDLRAFWVRRVARLLPASAALLTAAVVVSLVHPTEDAGADVIANAVSAALGLNNWWRIHASDSGGIWLGHIWSLSVEQQYYLVWPLLLSGLILALRRSGGRAGRPMVAVVAGLACVVAAWRIGLVLTGASDARWYFGTDTRADTLLVGSALALALDTSRRSGRAAHRTGNPPRAPGLWALAGWLGWLTLAVAVVLSPPLEGSPTYLALGGLLGVALAAGLVVAAVVVAPRRGAARLLSWGPMVRVGQISYAMYLWHYPIVAVLRGALAPRAGLWAATVASAVATVVVAWLSGIVVERPARRWITARLMPAQPARSARAVGIASSNSAI